MSALRQIADGKTPRISPLGLAIEVAPALPWVLLVMAIDNGAPGSMAGGLFLYLLGAALKQPWPIGPRLDRMASPEPGVWLTSPTRRFRRAVALLMPLLGLACATGMASAAFHDGDALALTLDAFIALGFAACVGWDAWRGLPVRLEARIDDQGLYSRALGGTIRLDQILEVLPRPRGEKFRLRLRVGPGAAGLPSYQRHRGGEMTLDLSAACLTHDVAVEALRRACPDLGFHVDAVPLDTPFVVPIKGVDHEENLTANWDEMEEQRRRFDNDLREPHVAPETYAYRPVLLQSIDDGEQDPDDASQHLGAGRL